MPRNQPPEKHHPVWAAVLILLGCYPLAIATGWLDVPPESVRAPLWVLALVGVVFVIAGGMVMVGQQSRWNHFLAGVLCTIFGVVGGWVALFAPSEGFSGGFPLFSHAINTAIGRWVFGLGALLSFSLALYGFRLFLQGKAGTEHAEE